MPDFEAMDLRDYCGLNRARFYVDPEKDASWFFGNREVEQELLDRMDSDIDVRGVPKCGVVGRFGIGKTHTLNHVRWQIESDPIHYPLRPVRMDVVWDEATKELNTWRAVHVRMLDAMGEPMLRELVRTLDAKTRDQDIELSEALYATFRFGDENLRRSLADILADNFKREIKSTTPAWQWLKADRAVKLENLGVPKALSDAGDMVFTILNLGNLCREALGKGLLFLMDEAQSLANVGRADAEVHRALLKLAEQDNKDVGFIIAVFGGGMQQIPKVITTPEDILSRIGVTRANLNVAFIELKNVLRTEAEIRAFIVEVLEHLHDPDVVANLVKQHSITGVSDPLHLPFTQDGIDRLAKVLFLREENRNPRIVIDTLAKCSSAAYRKAKADGAYQLVDTKFADPLIKDL